MATPTSPTKKSSSLSSPAAGRPPQAVKFSRRTSSGRIVSLSRDDELDMSGEFSGQNDYIDYTVLMPPTPDNQPMAESTGPSTSSDSKRDASRGYKSTRFSSDPQRPGDGGGGGSGGAKMDRGLSLMKSNNKSMLLRSQTGDFDHTRWLFESKGRYGIGNAYWQEDQEDAYDGGMSMEDFMDKPWKPLTRKIKVPPGVLSPYRFICLLKLFDTNSQIHETSHVAPEMSLCKS